jgi:hypothetical protein
MRILHFLTTGKNVAEKTEQSDSDEEDLLLKSPRGPAREQNSSDSNNIEIPHEYLLIILHMITGLFGPETSFVRHECPHHVPLPSRLTLTSLFLQAGCVLSIRRFGTMITLWNTDANDKAWIEHVRQLLAQLLNLPLESIVYQRHNKSLRNNARNLSKQSSKKKKKQQQHKGDGNGGEHGQPVGRSRSLSDPSENDGSRPAKPKVCLCLRLLLSQSCVNSRNLNVATGGPRHSYCAPEAGDRREVSQKAHTWRSF